MDLMQSPDQEAIQETVRSFLAKELPPEKLRAAFDDGVDLGLGEVWKRAGELGFFGLGLSEEEGGSGFALSEEMVLFTELGRTLAPGPWLGSVLAAHALSDESVRQGVVSGSIPCAWVDLSRGDSATVESGRVVGELPPVADLAVAEALLIACGDSWYYTERGDDGWDAEAIRSLDPTRPLYRVVLGDRALREIAVGEAGAQLRRAATILSCAEAVGGIERTLEMSVEYCKVRTQFDRPIGSFQAVKHRCADMAVRAEVARSATIYATVCVRDELEDADLQVSVAKLLCSEGYLRNGADNIQNHGGMGFTWECDAHLYLKRAHGFEYALGTRNAQLDAVVEGLRNG